MLCIVEAERERGREQNSVSRENGGEGDYESS